MAGVSVLFTSLIGLEQDVFSPRWFRLWALDVLVRGG